jgi:ribosome-associated toxin RatA of RatAB toxin-antitoxin module
LNKLWQEFETREKEKDNQSEMKRAIIFSLIFFSVLGANAFAQLNQKDMERLEKGAILVHSEKDATSGDQIAVGRVIFPAPIETVWQVITDYASYPKFLSDVRDVRIEKKEANQTMLRLKLKNLWPFPDYDLLIQIDESREAGAVKFQMKEGDFARYYGSWKLIPLKAGNNQDRTLAEYRFFQYIGWWWFPMIPKTLTNNSLVSNRLDDFRKRIRDIQIENSLEPEKVIQPFWKKSIFQDRKKQEQEKDKQEPKSKTKDQNQ